MKRPSAFLFKNERFDSYIKLLYLRSRWYDGDTARFTSKDSWRDYNRPLSLNGWSYTDGNPINLTDPSGHDPWWCDDRSDSDQQTLCRTSWNLDHGGKLDKITIKKFYKIHPDIALDLIRQQFDIKLPEGFEFRFAYYGKNGYGLIEKGTAGLFPWSFSTRWTEPELVGKRFLIDYKMGCIISIDDIVDRSAQAVVTDYIEHGLYISGHAFTEFDYEPNDIAGIMIHEATHAWQFEAARKQVPKLFRTREWYTKYYKGHELQAIEKVKNAHESHRITLTKDGYERQITKYEERNKTETMSLLILPKDRP